MGRPSADDEAAQWSKLVADRTPMEADWRMAAAYVLPGDFRRWSSVMAPPGTPAQRAETARYAYDGTGVKALPKYAAILNRLLTPHGQTWAYLQAPPDLRKMYRVREYFGKLNELLFEKRYSPRARFIQTSAESYMALGVYGNGPFFCGARKPSITDKEGGVKYVTVPFRDVYYLTDEDGFIIGVYRRFWLNIRQFKAKFPNEPLPKKLADQERTRDERVFEEFVHIIRPRTDYEPDRIDARRHPFVASYLCPADKVYIGPEEGFQSLPIITPRIYTAGGDPYGFGPAMIALPSLGSVNQMKRTILKQGQKAVDPVIFTHDDQAYNGRVNQTPGAVNPGYVSKEGRPLFHTLQSGNFSVAEALLTDERTDVSDAFFVTLFEILVDRPEMTATEVLERVAEKAALLAPTMGRLQAELAGPMIERELAVLAELGMLPEMPPELKEMNGKYTVEYTSPLAKSMHAEEVMGFREVFQMAIEAAQATQDSSPLDHFNLDVAIPEIAERRAVPTRWLTDPDGLSTKREGRAQQAEQQQLVDAAPALASVATAAMKGGAK
jgi:hypothetical protein